MEVLLNGKRTKLNPAQSIGKGGEADVFNIGQNRALKIFKNASHPDYHGLPHEQQAAQERLAVHQEKLKAFPRSLPARIVKPEDLATNLTGKQIVGYSMKFLAGGELLLRYSDRTFRQAGVTNESVVSIFKDLHTTVGDLHRSGVVIGDFNDLNVMVLGTEANLIDADSFQFGKFFCQVFTQRFVDPLLCDPQAQSLMLFRPHTADSDWYAFAVMLMQCLLFVDPYGGIYKPKGGSKPAVPHDLRPLHRITVFNPAVRYPKPAIPYKVLPDELLQYFHLVFEKDSRGQFPADLLDTLRWTTCTACNTEHARMVCPNCAQAAPAAVKSVTVIRGTVTATQLFTTRGRILAVEYQNGDLRWLVHENGTYRREDGGTVLHGGLDPKMHFGLCGNRTLLARDGLLLTLTPDNPQIDRLSVDMYHNQPAVAATENARYWVTSGQLMRDGSYGPELVGEVLTGQTQFWVGSKFGFGFYRAGELSVAFTFHTAQPGLNDNVTLPKFRGQLLEANCLFTDDRAWFFTSENIQGRTVNRCTVIRPNGTIEATTEAEAGDGSWLSTLRGKCAVGNFLLVATDDGIIRMEPKFNQILKTREFPDTESFVDAGCQLIAGRQGLYVVTSQEIRLLELRA